MNEPTLPREALIKLMDEVLPPVEPAVERSYPMWGDDQAVDARDDERMAVENFIQVMAERGLLGEEE
jgi:hypothetical protein